MRSKNLMLVCMMVMGIPLASGQGVAGVSSQMLQLQSTFKIVTKQVQTVSESRATARLHANQSSAQAAQELYHIAHVKNTVDTYGASSQLVDPCYQVGMANLTSNTKGLTDASAQRAQALVYATSDGGMVNSGGVPGFFGSTRPAAGVTYAATVSARARRHQSRYCTVSEADAGYCTLLANGMQGGDSDFSVHLAPGKTFGWDQTEAATDFVKTVTPLRPLPVSTGCSDAACKAALAERRQQEAYMSMARYSMLRFVESRSTQLVGEAKKAVK